MWLNTPHVLAQCELWLQLVGNSRCWALRNKSVILNKLEYPVSAIQGQEKYIHIIFSLKSLRRYEVYMNLLHEYSSKPYWSFNWSGSKHEKEPIILIFSRSIFKSLFIFTWNHDSVPNFTVQSRARITFVMEFTAARLKTGLCIPHHILYYELNTSYASCRYIRGVHCWAKQQPTYT